MITELKVHGFKSLNNFEIKFEKGLNVIVGPNGSGKTNICQVLTVLSSLPSGDLLNCLNYLGGTNSIFTKKPDTKIISILAIGLCSSNRKNEHYDLRYTYEVNIEIKDDTLHLNEALIIQRKTSKTYKQILKINSNDGKIVGNIIDKKNLGEYSKIIDNHKKIEFEYDKHDCLWGIMPKLFYTCYCIGADIVGLRLINIDPNVAREPCDIIESDSMHGNGKYLTNELYELLRNDQSKYEIESLLEQTLVNFKSLRVRTSQSDSKRYIEIDNQNGCTFSSANLSDGTLKLIAVLVAIINQVNYTVIIEELENYLHPKVDRLLVEYLRESFVDRSCILTSHSETILNLVRPSEIILCQNKEGVTMCNRIDDVEQMNKAIENSGLGCGYHYVIGNIE